MSMLVYITYARWRGRTKFTTAILTSPLLYQPYRCYLQIPKQRQAPLEEKEEEEAEEAEEEEEEWEPRLARSSSSQVGPLKVIHWAVLSYDPTGFFHIFSAQLSSAQLTGNIGSWSFVTITPPSHTHTNTI